jgi:SHS2 domain-containing protein
MDGRSSGTARVEEIRRVERTGRAEESGHRMVPHTADVRIEAWSPTREGCVAEAIRGMVDSFVDVPAVRAGEEREYAVSGDGDEGLLTATLDEVIFRMETDGEIPVSAIVEPADGGLRVRSTAVDAGTVRLVGAVPKAVSLHDLHFGPDEHGWSCRLTLDV